MVNARHIKAVPGRKTAVTDCEWIADLLRHGLLQPSFIPERPQRELRELTRYRTSLIQERTAEVNRLQKVLEGANIKLAAVATDIRGRSGRAILAALVGGAGEATTLAQLARGRLREKMPQLEQALAGQFGVHQRFLVAPQLAHIDFLDEVIERVSAEVAERVRPFEEAVALLDTIPGLGRRTAEGLVAEIGVEMTRFPTAAHRAAWAGVAPGNNASAGKRRSGRTRKGGHARAAPGCAPRSWRRHRRQDERSRRTWAPSFGAGCHARARSGRQLRSGTASFGHSILVIAYHLLSRREPYHDLGVTYFDQRARQTLERRLVRRLEALGYTVSLQPPDSAASPRDFHLRLVQLQTQVDALARAGDGVCRAPLLRTLQRRPARAQRGLAEMWSLCV